MKKALITGITGQDGAYLAEFLLDRGYEVHGLIRRSSTFNTSRINHIYSDPHSNTNLKLHYGDLSAGSNVYKLINSIKPDEVYNLAAMSHVKVSFDDPEYTMDVDATGVVRILDAIKEINPQIRYYQASSSEMFGKVRESPQNENTAFYPRSPYACAKVAAYYLTINYREAYNIHASNGILYNHEGPTRGETFVSRKITRAATRIYAGLQDKLYLGNLEAKRDWGSSKDYIRAMWMIVQHNQPDDYVVATGETHSVREFCEKAFGILGLNYKNHVEIDERYFRPTEVDLLLGDYTKINKILGWKPQVTFNDLVREMINSDLELAYKEKKNLQ